MKSLIRRGNFFSILYLYLLDVKSLRVSDQRLSKLERKACLSYLFRNTIFLVKKQEPKIKEVHVSFGRFPASGANEHVTSEGHPATQVSILPLPSPYLSNEDGW